jgi:hypothetical protein
MNANNRYPRPSPPKISTGRMWLGFFLSPTVWAIYFVMVYVIGEAACHLLILSPSMVLPLSTISGLMTLTAIGISARYAYRMRRQNDEGETGYFMGWTGLLLAGLFGLSTVAVWFSAWFLRPC